ncbi:uncharacterized protein LOC132708259 isoform X2 [Cylas formicarius]|nr:uncharacterized protein LOC132708259 isoform X2 [Cylas formicarius]
MNVLRVNTKMAPVAAPSENEGTSTDLTIPLDNPVGFTGANCDEERAVQQDYQRKMDENKEIECVTKLRTKLLLLGIPITLNYCTLDSALRSIASQKKILLLYLHNSLDDFGRNFNDALRKTELAKTVEGSFFFLGWNLDDPTCHDAITRALDRAALSNISSLVSQKASAAFCILPFNGTIEVMACLRGKISYRNIMATMKEAETTLHDEIKQEEELRKIESETSNENDFDVLKFQEQMAQMLGERDYDRFDKVDHPKLIQKIEYALFGPPLSEFGYDNKMKKKSQQLFEVILKESAKIAEYQDRVEIAFIYNCTQPLPKERLKRASKYVKYNPKTDITPVPVFVLRKCRGSKNNCRIFIDDCCRVYQSWRQYLTRNKLPECEMTVPSDGRYQTSDNFVLLEKHLSPACHKDAKILQAVDTTSTVAGVLSGGVFVAAAIPAITVAPFVLIGSAVVGAVVGGYAIGRSSYQIHDRRVHNQSMSFANSEARGAYLNILAGSLGFVGAGANTVLTQLAARGANIGQGARILANTIAVAKVGASGASLLNSGHEVIFEQWIKENRTPSRLALLQLATSMLFFTNSVVNFKTASTIVEESQTRVLQDYADSLRSNRHRKTFTKLTKETIRQQGGNQARGRAEVISTIRNIPNKDDLFAALTRNNKAMNREGIKFSADQGQIKLNGVAINMDQFARQTKTQTQTFFENLMNQQATEIDASPPSEGFSWSLDGWTLDSAKTLTYLTGIFKIVLCFDKSTTEKVVQVVHTVLMTLSKPLINELNSLMKGTYQACRQVMMLVMNVFYEIVHSWEKKYNKWKETGDSKYFDPFFNYVDPASAKRLKKFLNKALELSVSGERVVSWVIEKAVEYVTTWITKKLFDNNQREERARNEKRHYNLRRVECFTCWGTYFSH